ncbi:hypothetical protein [Pseudomonas helvetica]
MAACRYGVQPFFHSAAALLGAGINAVALVYWLLTLKSGAPERCAVPANQ